MATDVILTSYDSWLDYRKERIEQSAIKQVKLKDIIVDSGASMMCLSKKLIDQLGLELLKITKVNTAEGITERGIYGPVIYEIQGRIARGDVLELSHPKIEALVGQIPLEQLDFLINPASNRLIPNPEHEGELILDQLILSDMLRCQPLKVE
ncbi:hypothetical protein D5085_06230 [Ectothiorhodospiraceae bacterium BW-2]|nr:hypothetical protein D5085_06230 [Ectothiorhodospiraceae bacterium BW-2]